MRYFLEIAYLGTGYSGWQRQKNGISVQEKIENVLKVLLKHPVETTGAGRTDAGVHARQLFAHFETEAVLKENFLLSINAMLPRDIAVNALYQPVDQRLHARFGVLSRSYEYQITLVKSPFLTETASFLYGPFDTVKMEQACAILKEYDRFECFCKLYGDNNTFFCKLKEAGWEERGSMLKFRITADRFLRGMVRLIVGTMLEVGRGKKSLDEFRFILESQDLKLAGPSAEAKGLFLTEVNYPEGALRKIQLH